LKEFNVEVERVDVAFKRIGALLRPINPDHEINIWRTSKVAAAIEVSSFDQYPDGPRVGKCFPRN
jgi:hypothetical protein